MRATDSKIQGGTIKAVKVRVNPPFIWNTGLATPVYCDHRLIPSYPEKRRQVVSGLKAIVADKQLEFDVIAGTATAGIPWAAFLAYELDKPMVYVRAQTKDYGRAKQQENYLSAEDKTSAINWSENPEQWSKNHGGA